MRTTARRIKYAVYTPFERRHKLQFHLLDSRNIDVLVAGGGNAALCAALSASEQGASVLVAECAPKEFRGGNSRHTRNLRAMHETPGDFLTGDYTAAEYLTDLLRVTGGDTNEELARLTIGSSAEAMQWMRGHGVRFQAALGGTLHLGRTNAFFLGGGKALMNTYYAAAAGKNIRVLYDAEVIGLRMSGGKFESATLLVKGEPAEIHAKALVAASGGFESNLEWLEEAWGPAARNFLIRGTRYNKGRVLKLLLENGAQSVGDPKQCHAVAIDARAPKFDGGIVTRLDSLPLGIVLNKQGVRFYDEGEDLWPKRYAIWGRLVAQQGDQIAFSIVDSKLIGKFMPSVYPAVRADTIAELAGRLELPSEGVEATIAQYNSAVQPGAFDLTRLDDCRTCGLAVEKTHWAQKIDTPPFLGYPLRPGITFTYLGVGVDANARLKMRDGSIATNVFAAGEIMAGNILSKGYLGGFGMTIGTVFGRIAGREAARAAR
jgi:tricarballylate dehydrogenase